MKFSSHNKFLRGTILWNPDKNAAKKKKQNTAYTKQAL